MDLDLSDFMSFIWKNLFALKHQSDLVIKICQPCQPVLKFHDNDHSMTVKYYCSNRIQIFRYDLRLQKKWDPKCKQGRIELRLFYKPTND